MLLNENIYIKIVFNEIIIVFIEWHFIVKWALTLILYKITVNINMQAAFLCFCWLFRSQHYCIFFVSSFDAVALNSASSAITLQNQNHHCKTMVFVNFPSLVVYIIHCCCNCLSSAPRHHSIFHVLDEVLRYKANLTPINTVCCLLNYQCSLLLFCVPYFIWKRL